MPDWMSTAIPGFVGGLLGASAIQAAILAWWGQKLKTKSEKALSEFQHHLQMDVARATHTNARNLQEFSLFVLKRHEAIGKLHELLLDATSKVVLFSKGHRERMALEDLEPADFEAFMGGDGQIPEGKRAAILDLFQADRPAAIKAVYEHQDSMQPEYARRAIVKAHNARLAADIYLPTEVRELAASLDVRLNRLLGATSLSLSRDPNATRLEIEAVLAEHAGLRDALRIAIARSDPVELVRGTGAGVS